MTWTFARFDRFQLALAWLDEDGRRLADRLIAQIEASPAGGEQVHLASVPVSTTARRYGDTRAVRGNRSDCARSLAVLYRIEGERVMLMDILTLPPRPPPKLEPPKEPTP